MLKHILHTKNNVHYLTEPNDKFSNLYLNIRNKEQRVLKANEVKLLPKTLTTNPYKNEWLLRAKSTKRFIKYLKTKEQPTILDIGCGNGWFTNLISKYSKYTIGLDINTEELEQAKCRGVL